MFPICNFASISADFKGILLDAYGVFWGGNEVGLLPGSMKEMEQLIEKGKVVGILSNTTQLGEQEAKKFSSHGLIQGRHYHFVVTAGDVAKEIFFYQKLPFPTPRHKFWTFGERHPRYSSHEIFFHKTPYEEVNNLEEADFIFIAIPHIGGEDQTDPELFRENIILTKKIDLPMVCPNPDRFAHEGKPPKAVVRQGSIGKIYEEIGGKVFYIGKPYPEAYEMALANFRRRNIFIQDILMVGDTPETDIRGAKNFGIRSALLIETGILADRIALEGQSKVITSLPLSDHPDFFVGRLADGR